MNTVKVYAIVKGTVGLYLEFNLPEGEGQDYINSNMSAVRYRKGLDGYPEYLIIAAIPKAGVHETKWIHEPENEETYRREHWKLV